MKLSFKIITSMMNNCTRKNRRINIIYLDSIPQKMGNTYCCQQYYYTLPCTPQSKKYVLSHKIQKSLSSSKFRDVCKRTIQRYFDESLQLEQEQNLRRSTASFSHYESNNLNNSILEQQTQKMIGGVKNHFPQKSQKPNSDRQKYLLRLIRQSYLFLDLSDCLDNRKSYDRFIKHELIKDPSLDSFITNEKASVIAHLEMELKNFNQSLIQKLQNYVRFCRKVKHDFTPDNQRFLSKLNLNLQSQIIQKYLNKDLRREPNELLLMLEDVNEVLRILMMIVEEMYNLNIEKNSQQAGSISEDEFFCPFNLFTMIASIVFDSSEFSDFIIDKIKQCFKQSFTKFKNENTYTTSQFVSDFIALNSNNFRRQSRESNISLLYTNNNYSSLNIFVKTKRLIQKLFDKSVPLYKLKIIYQIYQQMSKEQQQLKNILYEKYNVDLNSVFNRQGDLLVVKWLLKENRQRIDTIASHILFTYYFIHSIHRSDIKGSSIVTYIDQIQRIINHQWNSPN